MPIVLEIETKGLERGGSRQLSQRNGFARSKSPRLDAQGLRNDYSAAYSVSRTERGKHVAGRLSLKVSDHDEVFLRVS